MFSLPGLGPATRRLVRHFLPQGKRVWIQIPAGLGKGLCCKVDPYLEEGYLRGDPEPGVQEAIVRYLQPGGCFYDVGAHIGFYSLGAARIVGPSGRVVAFEPDPDNWRVLQENIARNGLHQVTAEPLALWSSEGVIGFKRNPNGQGSTRRGFVVPEGSVAGRVVQVRARTLDGYVKEHPAPTFIKIDVEGAETEVLKGGRRLFAEVRPVLLCEVHHKQAREFMEAELRRKGYTLELLPTFQPFPFPRFLLARPA
jgi:FkbM family methyltransferase